MSGDDIVNRLRVRRGAQGHPMGGHNGWCDLTDPEKLEAADEIVRLRAERDASRLIINDLSAEIKRLRALITEWDATCETLRRPPRQWSEGDWYDAGVRLDAAVNALIAEARRA